MTDTHNYVKDLNLAPNTHHRGRCPVCNSPNTFGAVKKDGVIMYHCFRASCGTRGAVAVTQTMSELKSRIGRVGATASDTRSFNMPESLVKGVTTPDGVQWLKNHNAYDSYRDRLYDIYTDVAQDRLVIPLYNEVGTLVNAGGRSWNPSVQPKFRFYNRGGPVYPCVIGTGGTVVIVEDFASAAACATDRRLTGFALLGTNFNSSNYLPVLQQLTPTKIVIALDRDATNKAIKLKNFLTFLFESVTIHRLNDKDIKDMNYEELQLCLTQM